MILSQGNGYEECGAQSQGAIHPHGTAMKLHQLLDQRQADAGALVRSAASIGNPVKAVEKMTHFFGRNSDASISNPQFSRMSNLGNAHLNLTLEGKLQCIRN